MRFASRTKLEDAALGEAESAAAFVPLLRPRGEPVLAEAGRAAAQLGENEGNVPDAFVAVALRLVDAADRRAIVECFATREPDLYARLRRVIPYELETALVRSAIKGAICDRRPVSRVDVLVLEHARPLPKLAPARLGLVLPPTAVWSVTDALWLLDKNGLSCKWDRWRDDVEPAVLDRVEDWQIERVKLLADALARHLPYPSLPRASKILARDCARVCGSDAEARATAGALLLAHAAMAAATGVSHSLN